MKIILLLFVLTGAISMGCSVYFFLINEKLNTILSLICASLSVQVFSTIAILIVIIDERKGVRRDSNP